MTLKFIHLLALFQSVEWFLVCSQTYYEGLHSLHRFNFKVLPLPIYSHGLIRFNSTGATLVNSFINSHTALPVIFFSFSYWLTIPLLGFLLYHCPGDDSVGAPVTIELALVMWLAAVDRYHHPEYDYWLWRYFDFTIALLAHLTATRHHDRCTCSIRLGLAIIWSLAESALLITSQCGSLPTLIFYGMVIGHRSSSTFHWLYSVIS